MKLKIAGESERLLLSLVVVFTVYYAANLAIVFFAEGKESDSLFMHYTMTLSLLLGILAGMAFFFAARESTEDEIWTKEKSISILKRALNKDEATLLEIIRDSEGITQDSLRFRTGFSKSKLSIILSSLEKSGIIVREKLGKTYKLYTGEWLEKGESTAKEASK